VALLRILISPQLLLHIHLHIFSTPGEEAVEDSQSPRKLVGETPCWSRKPELGVIADVVLAAVA
jgi:hypothetical protein